MFLSKYGVARHIYIPIVKRSVVDFAVSADWTPAAGDVKISKDGGAAANVTNLPTAITMGNTAMWDFSLTATEMQAAQVVVMVADSATKAVEDQSFIIQTYGNASAMFQVDLADSVRAGLTALPNAAAGANGGLPTGDASGRVDVGKVLGTAQTAGDIPSLIQALFTTAMTESYAADGSAPTPAQALFLIQQRLTEFAISGTTITVKKLDGSTTAATLTLDDATAPTSSTRAS